DIVSESIDRILQELENKTNLKFKQIGSMIGVSKNRKKSTASNSPDVQSRTKTEPTQKDNVLISVSGTVTDQNGEPLIGVNIAVEGSNQGAATDFEGQFDLMDVGEDAILIVSYIGYKTQRIPLDGRSTLTIIL